MSFVGMVHRPDRGGLTPLAANETVTQFPSIRKFPLSRSGVLVLSGFGIKVRVHNRHLELEDGVGLER